MAVFAYARLEGAQDVMRALQNFSDEALRERLMEAVKAGAEVVAEDARARAPVRTGRLKASIKTRVPKKGLTAKVEADYPAGGKVRKTSTKKQKAGSREYYAFAVEYGTRKMPAQPFMAPALAAKAPQVMMRMETALKEACREAQRNI